MAFIKTNKIHFFGRWGSDFKIKVKSKSKVKMGYSKAKKEKRKLQVFFRPEGHVTMRNFLTTLRNEGKQPRTFYCDVSP